VAAALQDAGRAVIMGAKSSGITAGYEFLELSDGSAVYLPTVRWYRPSGQLLGHEGIIPDVRVTLEPEASGLCRESQFNCAYDLLDALLPPFR
jgi:carboxyl-terminal processing protease